MRRLPGECSAMLCGWTGRGGDTGLDWGRAERPCAAKWPHRERPRMDRTACRKKPYPKLGPRVPRQLPDEKLPSLNGWRAKLHGGCNKLKQAKGELQLPTSLVAPGAPGQGEVRQPRRPQTLAVKPRAAGFEFEVALLLLIIQQTARVRRVKRESELETSAPPARKPPSPTPAACHADTLHNPPPAPPVPPPSPPDATPGSHPPPPGQPGTNPVWKRSIMVLL